MSQNSGDMPAEVQPAEVQPAEVQPAEVQPMKPELRKATPSVCCRTDVPGAAKGALGLTDLVLAAMLTKPST